MVDVYDAVNGVLSDAISTYSSLSSNSDIWIHLGGDEVFDFIS